MDFSPTKAVKHGIATLEVHALESWFLAHRHGQLKGMVDANQNGIDDRIEAALARVEQSKK